MAKSDCSNTSPVDAAGSSLSTPTAASRLAAILSSSTDAFVGQTLEGIVTDWSGSAEATFGYAAGEIIGQPIAVLLPPGGRGNVR